MNPTTAQEARSSSGAVLLPFALSAERFFNELGFSRNDRLGSLQKDSFFMPSIQSAFF